MKELFGTGVALVTPFNRKLEVDFDGLARLLEHTSEGVDYFVVMGTTGESPTISKEEKKAILKFVKTNNRRRLPLVYGIGGNSTREVIEAIEGSDLDGVDAVLSVSPYYNKPSQEGIYLHFKAIGDASPLPIILYNVPGRTGSNITAETTLRLANHPNIAGIKEASGNIEQCMRIARDKPENFMLISGDDMLTLPIFSLGGHGVISVLANAYPMVFRKMKDYFLDCDMPRASREAFKLIDMNPLMYEEGNPVGLKALLAMMNICSKEVRSPLAEASDNLVRKISAAQQKIRDSSGGTIPHLTNSK